MAYQFPPEVHELVRNEMAAGDYASEDELLIDALRALANRNADLAAVTEATRDMEAGNSGRPLRDVANEIRATHALYRPSFQ